MKNKNFLAITAINKIGECHNAHSTLTRKSVYVLVSFTPFKQAHLGTSHINHISFGQNFIYNFFTVKNYKFKASRAIGYMITNNLVLHD